jgi:hypothetical protein
MVWRNEGKFWFDDEYLNEYLTDDEYNWRIKK